jgi:hypothetical protein
LLTKGTEQYDDIHTYLNTTGILYPYLPLLYRDFALMYFKICRDLTYPDLEIKPRFRNNISRFRNNI